jgi:hypothetical protein
LRGYATILQPLSVEALKKALATGQLPDYSNFGITPGQAEKICKVVCYRKEHDLVQFNTDIPKSFREKISKFVGRHRKKGLLTKLMVKGLGREMREYKGDLK